MLPSLRFSPQEQSQLTLLPETLDQMETAFTQAGCLLLEQVFPQATIQQVLRYFLLHYRRFLTPDSYHEDALRVGDERWMVTVKLKGAFADPLLWAHPLIYPLFSRLLGEELILNSFGVVVSLPGAKAQHEHRDLPALFGDQPIDAMMPCFAMTLMVPLISCNEHHGTTMLRVGSHLVSEQEAEGMEETRPEVPTGSCLLMDYRLHHGGTANLSQTARPLLYAVFSKPWLRDYRNFKKQHPLCIPRRTLAGISPHLQGLFAQARVTWW
ncbi:MAG: phytanoyl-CoA dioxygenase family protein [Myxococcales bacterium]|nr:phytanoyl-CoA dioxygenase family protein [Myxococcales bacterium]